MSSPTGPATHQPFTTRVQPKRVSSAGASVVAVVRSGARPGAQQLGGPASMTRSVLQSSGSSRQQPASAAETITYSSNGVCAGYRMVPRPRDATSVRAGGAPGKGPRVFQYGCMTAMPYLLQAPTMCCGSCIAARDTRRARYTWAILGSDSIGDPMRPNSALLPLAVLAAALLVSGGARADGTYLKLGPGGVIPLESHAVRMVRERIDAELLTAHRLAPAETFRVTVTYTFENLTARALTVPMGFPVGFDWYGVYDNTRHCNAREVRSPLADFAAAVDGEPVPVERMQTDWRSRPTCFVASDEDAVQRAKQLSRYWYDAYFVWRVPFLPGETVEVRNSYTFDARAEVHRRPWTVFRYVLRTGAAWYGAIEQVDIRVRFGDRVCLRSPRSMDDDCGRTDALGERVEPDDFDADPFVVYSTPHHARPAGARIERLPDGGDQVVWSLRDIEPADDVHFAYSTLRDARAAIRGRIAELDPKTLSAERRALARDTLLALYGVSAFADPARAKHLTGKSWFLADPQMTVARARALDPLIDRFDPVER